METLRWEDGPTLPRGFDDGAFINENQLILIGGEDENSKTRKDLMFYNEEEEEFQLMPGEMKTPRRFFAAMPIQANC